MTLHRVLSATVSGVDGQLVYVESDIGGGLPAFSLVGLPETSVREARIRVQAAIHNSGASFPLGRITVNLAPANIPKNGSGFDAPVALSLLAADRQIDLANFKDWLVIGELALDGTMRGVCGVLCAAEAAKKSGLRSILVPEANGKEAAMIDGLEVYTARHFKEILAHIRNPKSSSIQRARPFEVIESTHSHQVDMADIKGNRLGKRALEIMATGGHHLLLAGGPGTGKSMLAKCLPSILPAPTHAEGLEIARIHSLMSSDSSRMHTIERPFRSPHHSSSMAGLAGGGSGMARPGEITLAHGGVLFLDELTEFSRTTLEVLRQPLEDGVISLSRSKGQVDYPARFQVIAAMNPCPCGYYGDPRKRCRCRAERVKSYQSRLSGPLLDRIDLFVAMPPISLSELNRGEHGEDSETVRKRVEQARDFKRHRGQDCSNSLLSFKELRADDMIDAQALESFVEISDKLELGNRSCIRVLRVARTIADMRSAQKVEMCDIREALSFRMESIGLFDG